MRINVTVLILAALMAGLAGCDEALQLGWNDTLGTRNAAWTGIENRGTLTLINASPRTTLHQTVDAGSAVTFIVTSKIELDTTTSNLILTTRGKQYDAALALIEAPFMLPGIRNYRSSFTPTNDTPSGAYTISSSLWESGGARQHLTLGKLNLVVEGDNAPPAISDLAVSADSSPIRVGGVITLSFSANEALDIERTQAIFTISGEQRAQSVTLVPNTEYQYQTTLTVTDAVPDGTLEEVVVAAYDAAGNAERFTQSADLIIEKVAPPPPDTTPPMVSDIVVSADSSPIRVGGVITLSFSANEALDIANTQAIFTIAGEQRAQSVTLVPNTEYQYQTTLSVTDAVADGTLEEVVINAQDAAGNSGRFTQSADLTIEKVAPPPPDTTPPAVSDIAVSADSSPIRVGGVITLSFSANEALDIANTQAIFTIAGEQHAQSVTLVPNTEYRYQAMLAVTDAVPNGTLEAVIVNAQDAAGNRGQFTQSADLTIEKVAPPPPDTTPPAVTNIAVSADSSPIRVGGVITLSFSANEALDIANTQAIFTIAGEQRAQSVTLVPNTEYQYQTTLSVTDAVSDGTLEAVVVAAHETAGNSERFTQSTDLTIEKVAPPDTAPPGVTVVSATSDNEDSAIAEPGNTVTLTITTDEPIVISQSRLTFMIANTSHGRALRETTTKNQYTAQLRITATIPAGVLRASLILEDATGNRSDAIDKETTLTIVPPPDTAPPVVVAVRATSDNEDSTRAEPGNTVTLTITTDEPIVVSQSRLTFMVANSSHSGNIMAAADAANQYTAQLRITDAMPAEILRVSLILEDISGNRSDAIVKDTAVTITPTEPPTIVTITTTADNQDGTRAEPNNTVTVVFETSKPIVVKRSTLSFITADNIAYDRIISAVPNATNQYTSQLQVTDTMAAGQLRLSIVLADADGNRTDPIVRDIGVAVSEPLPLVALDPSDLNRDKPYHLVNLASHRPRIELQNFSRGFIRIAQSRTDDQVLAYYRIEGGLSFFDVHIDFILYDLYSIYLEEQPEKVAEAMQEGGIILHPIVKNGLLFDWLYLKYKYADKNTEELLILFRQLVRFWGFNVNRYGEGGIIVPDEEFVYALPPKDPYTSLAVREMKRELERVERRVQRGLDQHPFLQASDLYNGLLSLLPEYRDFNIETIFSDLWTIYKEERPEQTAGITADDIPLHPISNNGLLFAWLALQADNPDKSKEERLVFFRHLAREGKVQLILTE